MAFSTRLGSAAYHYAEVTFDSIRGEGAVAPRLVLLLGVKTTGEWIEGQVQRLRLSLSFERERVAQGEMSPFELWSLARPLPAVLPISRRALAFIDERARGEELGFELEIEALLHVRRTQDRTELIQPEVPLNEWASIVAETAQLSFSIPRSVWYSKVVAPITDRSFVSVEIEVPSTASGLAASYARLLDAERAYGVGDDPAVFAQCRGAIEALPGYPGRIFHAIGNAKKRQAADRLLKQAGLFLHAGRHVSREGQDAGTFPVDHRDAAFALNLTRLLLAYIGRIHG